MKYGTVTEITQEQRWMLVGLLVLAADQRKILTCIQNSVALIIGEPAPSYDRAADFVWGAEGDADKLLELEEIKVVDAKAG